MQRYKEKLKPPNLRIENISDVLIHFLFVYFFFYVPLQTITTIYYNNEI